MRGDPTNYDPAKAEWIEAEYQALIEEDREDYAQNIIDKMFSQFKMGHKWLLRMSDAAENEQQVWSPIHRIRHLYATITKDRQIVSRQVRRGMNAPIQGFVLTMAVLYVGLNLAIDILYVVIDPRVGIEA